MHHAEFLSYDHWNILYVSLSLSEWGLVCPPHNKITATQQIVPPHETIPSHGEATEHRLWDFTRC